MNESKTLERQASVPGEFLSGVGVWVPPHPDLKSKDEIQPICISIRSIDNLPVKVIFKYLNMHTMFKYNLYSIALILCIRNHMTNALVIWKPFSTIRHIDAFLAVSG